MTTKQDNRFQPKKQRKKKAIKMHLQENKLVSDNFLGVATGESSQSMWFYENTQVYLTRISFPFAAISQIVATTAITQLRRYSSARQRIFVCGMEQPREVGKTTVNAPRDRGVVKYPPRKMHLPLSF
ncbi:hypothetical protein CDAR_314721 [Caerostris darwini]|uniref:Uncharacterized protein n=1 Tax=Caerostris darwini TaxID=1538125 RepID=A0AAV4TSC7_9ARAC|nr:hypothetical protein CDAR_314721 [Caerostris darwini]